MASAGLRKELDCSICLDIYTDPVNLRCGHNYCRVCIDRVLDTQKESGGYSCPECREEFQDRPELQRNVTLRNIVEAFRSTQPDQEETEIFCTYCIHSPVPAVKFCVMCEASLCDNHLRVHSKSPEHVLTDPTTTMEKRKCSVHKKIQEYYCHVDATCICMSCSLIGDHQGHKVETLDEAYGKKKQTLKNLLQKVNIESEETEKSIQSLQDCRRKVQEKAAGVTERVGALFRDLRRQLEELEKRSLKEISRQEEQLALSLSDLIQQLEIKKDELSRRMNRIEEMCNMSDPLAVLQQTETGDLYDTKKEDTEDKTRYDKLFNDGDNLDGSEISRTLHTGLCDVIKGVNVCFYVQDAAEMLLDVNTAHNNLHLSYDLKTVSWSDIEQKRPVTPERFQIFNQVLGSRRFSLGQHYWEVDVSQSDRWTVGMCYPSIERKGNQSWIGYTPKCWSLYRNMNQCSVLHNNKVTHLPGNIPSNTVRIYLDYEGGRLSFYELSDPIRQLHTFTATFTEPLHAALWVGKGSIKLCGGSGYDRFQ